MSSFPQSYVIPDFRTMSKDSSRTAALVALFQQHAADQRYVNEVAAATSFAEAAKRGLVLGAAIARHQVLDLAYPPLSNAPAVSAAPSSQSDNSILATRFNSVASVGENAVYVNQATNWGTFAFCGFVPFQELTIVEWIKKKLPFNGVVMVLRAESDGLTKRHVAVQAWQLVQHAAVLAAVRTGKLTVVCGPSGGGKTTTTLSSLRGYPCIYLCQTLSAADDEALLGTMTDPQRNEKVVTQLIEMIEPLLCGFVTKKCSQEVVLIVDELGQTPNFLRALCALYKPKSDKATPSEEEENAHRARQGLWTRLRDVLLVDTLRLVAVGTGCDRPEGTVGSKNSSYTIVHMDDAWGETVRDKLLDQPTLDPSLRTALQCAEDSFEMGRVCRALLNPRVAALFVEEAAEVHHRGCDWVRCAPHVLSIAFEKFFTMNALEGLDFRERADRFARALALSLGGPTQTLDVADTLICTKYGLIADTVKRISADQFDDKEHIKLGPDSREGDALVVPKNTSHRFVMSAATHEMILGSVFGISAHVRTGEGFELTMVDFLLVQLLAGSTDVKIAAVADDALEAVKTATRELAAKVDVLLAMQLRHAARTPAQALEEAASRAALFVNRTQPDAHVGMHITFAAVVRNCDKAPAADAFVVRGTLTRTDEAHEWVPEVPTTGGTPSPISLQFKHYTKSSEPQFERVVIEKCVSCLDTVEDHKTLFIVGLLPRDSSATNVGETTFVRLHEGDAMLPQRHVQQRTAAMAVGELSRSLHPIAVHSAAGGQLDSFHFVSFARGNKRVRLNETSGKIF